MTFADELFDLMSAQQDAYAAAVRAGDGCHARALRTLIDECERVIGRLTIHCDDEARVLEARDKLGFAIDAARRATGA